DEAILVEPEARHTGENITRTRTLLDEKGISVRSVILITRPYQQRRAYATAAHHWPGIKILTSAQPLALDDYVRTIGGPDLVVHMLVGDTQRIWVYAEQAHAIPQQVPAHVRAAYDRLVTAGYTLRLVPRVGPRPSALPNPALVS
ncbi:MAG: ElyC/SanA/YdcF family protein, partial [Kineosporiaceae bacterium]